jgi:hypothetical protein
LPQSFPGIVWHQQLLVAAEATVGVAGAGVDAGAAVVKVIAINKFRMVGMVVVFLCLRWPLVDQAASPYKVQTAGKRDHG